jgi:hypothetical protein
MAEAADGAPPDPVVQLEWVLGVNPGAVHALAPAGAGAGAGSGAGAGAAAGLRVAYMSGNVGIIYDTATKTQTLLRGHVSRGGDSLRGRAAAAVQASRYAPRARRRGPPFRRTPTLGPLT